MSHGHGYIYEVSLIHTVAMPFSFCRFALRHYLLMLVALWYHCHWLFFINTTINIICYIYAIVTPVGIVMLNGWLHYYYAFIFVVIIAGVLLLLRSY